MSCSRRDLQYLIGQLQGWSDNPSMPGLFKTTPSKPTTDQPVKPADKLKAKELSGGGGAGGG